MKKLICIIALILLFSCSKEKDEANLIVEANSDKITTKKLETILKSENSTIQRISFEILSANEKCNLWKMHLYKLLPKFVNAPEKYEFIFSIARKLTPEMFGNERESFMGDFTKDEYSAAKIFSNEELIMLFYSLNNNLTKNIQIGFKLMVSNQSVQTSDFVDNDDAKDCDCNADGHPNTCTDSWLGGYTYCAKGENGCKTVNSGCGWFWSYRCNGDCKVVILDFP